MEAVAELRPHEALGPGAAAEIGDIKRLFSSAEGSKHQVAHGREQDDRLVASSLAGVVLEERSVRAMIPMRWALRDTLVFAELAPRAALLPVHPPQTSHG